MPEHKKYKFFVILTKLAAIAGHVMPIRRYEPLNRRVSTTMNGLVTDFLYDRWDLVSENGYRSLLPLYSLSAATITDARTNSTTHTYDLRARSRRSQVIGELPKSSVEIFKILQQTGR